MMKVQLIIISLCWWRHTFNCISSWPEVEGHGLPPPAADEAVEIMDALEEQHDSSIPTVLLSIDRLLGQGDDAGQSLHQQRLFPHCPLVDSAMIACTRALRMLVTTGKIWKRVDCY